MSELDSYETGLAMINEITITLNRIEDFNPDAKEYITGIRDILTQILKSMDKGHRVTDKQLTVLKNILSGIKIGRAHV